MAHTRLIAEGNGALSVDEKFDLITSTVAQEVLAAIGRGESSLLLLKINDSEYQEPQGTSERYHTIDCLHGLGRKIWSWCEDLRLDVRLSKLNASDSPLVWGIEIFW